MTDVHEHHPGLVIPPSHDAPDLSNALLAEVGTECRDMAAAMAVCRAATRDEVRAGMETVRQLDPDLAPGVQ